MDDKPAFLGFHTGLSGEEVTPGMVRKIAEKTLEAARGRVKPLVEWV